MLETLVNIGFPAGCIAKGKYSKEGCSVSLKGAPTPPIMIDLDKPQAPVRQNDPKCDYIFIGGCGDVWLAPLELKKGELDASKVVKQLQAGADIADAHIIPANEQVQFQPVAVFGGRLHPASTRSIIAVCQSNSLQGQAVQHPVIEVWPTLN